MAAEKAVGIVVRTTDWSETSRIATIWTRELGKVRVLAKGGRRLKSSFEVALDLLTVCSIVLLRKSSGGLDLLTEARVEERFGGLRKDLRALNAGYYVAELLGDGTQDYDPHPALYEFSLDTLRKLSAGGDVAGLVSAFELGWLGELGLRPVLDRCAACQTRDLPAGARTFSAIAGGIVCPECAPAQRDRRLVSRAALDVLEELVLGELPKVTGEVRQLLGHAVSTVLGRRPRLLSYVS
ncbi:MAG TPA: DNA repair protein RecO [Gemmataceae bacterium]|jgi:DNA repair protein RecO (recombination protein O)|nr:DNA repair protein RecO [Gemmataceae bacterium]